MEKTQQKIENEPIEEVEYYKSAFALLDKEEKHTWNWCAFLFGPTWALYRKMYLYSFLGMILLSLLTIIIKFIMIKSITPEAWENSTFAKFIELVSAIFCYVIWGYFGNALYYRTVKKRIKRATICWIIIDLLHFGGYLADILRVHLCRSEIILLAKSTFRCMH